MRIANVLAGFSLADSDGLRKAMGKKLPEVMAKYRDRFIDGCVANSVTRKIASDIWDMIERFAGYGFNKAHSAAYAVIAAQTAYLKAHYPVEFMAAILSTEIGTTEKIISNVVECRRQKIPVLLPDVNRSYRDFSVEPLDGADGPEGGLAIRFGLAAIRNVGEGAVRAIVAAREEQEGGRFIDLEHFCESVDWSTVTKRVVECLARSGAFDGFGDRSSVIAAVDGAVAAGQRRQKAASRGQIGLFDMLAGSRATTVRTPQPVAPVPARPSAELLAWEKELLGVYISSHPLSDLLAEEIGESVVIADARERPAGETVRLIGMINGVRRVTTRKNRSMAILSFEDLTGAAELVAFPDCYDQHSSLWVEGMILDVSAKIDHRNDQVQFICESARSEIPRLQKKLASRKVVLTVARDSNSERLIEMLHDLATILREFPGDDEFIVRIPRGSGTVSLRSRSRLVDWSKQLAAVVQDLAGSQAVQVLEPEGATGGRVVPFTRDRLAVAATGD